MTTQQAVVDQIVQNLAFEVEAVPKNKSIQDVAISQITPLNVKIKVRKKDDILKVHDVSTIADDNRRAVQKIRLVNSHQTIMTFDVFMEAEFEKKPSRNRRKHIFNMLRPGNMYVHTYRLLVKDNDGFGRWRHFVLGRPSTKPGFSSSD